MVSWSDETSEDSVLNISSCCDGIIKLPATMHDPNFNGTDVDVNVLCEHDSMEKALAKLWDMYEETKSARTNDNLESSFAIHNLTDEKKKLQENYDSLYADVNALLNAQQERGWELTNQKEQKQYLEVKIAELETVVGNLKAELSKKEEEKKKLQENYDSLYADVNSLLDAQQQRVGNLKAELSKTEEEKKKMLLNYETLKNLTCAQANVIRNLKFNHLKEKERLTKERLKLQYHISELQKFEEKIKLKLQGVKAILDE
ncbi:hypothetical protein CFC21_081705 [Triticum aestivum]|uniref:Uncharacterized protein n=2 Tax=Triticum aestivum TaxID=4565 RepID=A0A3B6NKD2_WHEAT|nr:hypothetical protein CFC21_081705 [Triticum aestivum]